MINLIIAAKRKLNYCSVLTQQTFLPKRSTVYQVKHLLLGPTDYKPKYCRSIIQAPLAPSACNSQILLGPVSTQKPLNIAGVLTTQKHQEYCRSKKQIAFQVLIFHQMISCNQARNIDHLMHLNLILLQESKEGSL